MSVFDIYSTYLTDEGYVSENSFFDSESLYHYKFVIHDHYIPRTVTSYYYGDHPMAVNCHGYLNAPLMYKTNVVDPIYYDTEINENLTSTLNITKDGSITVTALDTYDENLSDYENLDNVEVTINGGQFNGTNSQNEWYNIPFANSSPKTITYKLKVNTYGRRGNVSDDTYLTPPYASLAPFISYRDSRYTYTHEIYIVKLDNGKSLICASIFNGKRNIADDGSAVSTTDITIVTSNKLNIDWSVYHDIKLESFFKKHPSYNYECTYIKLSIDNIFIPFHSLLDSGNISSSNPNTYYCDTDVNSEYYGYLTIVTHMDNSRNTFREQNYCASTFVNIGSYDSFNTDAKNTKWNVSIKKLEISDIDLPTTWKFYSSKNENAELPQEGYSNFLYFTPGGYNPRYVIKAKNNYGFEGIRCQYECTNTDFLNYAFYYTSPSHSQFSNQITSDREFRFGASDTYFSLKEDIHYVSNRINSTMIPFETDTRTYFSYYNGTINTYTITAENNSSGGGDIQYGNVVNTLENTEDVTFENDWCRLNGTTNRGIIINSASSSGSMSFFGIQYELFFKLTHEDIVNIKNNLSSPDGHVVILTNERNFKFNNNYIALLYKPNLIVGNEDTLGRNILGDEIDGWFEVCKYNGTYSLETYALYPKLKSQDVYHLSYILRNYGTYAYNTWNIISLNGVYLFVGDYNKLRIKWYNGIFFDGTHRTVTFFTKSKTGTEDKIWCSFRNLQKCSPRFPTSIKIDAICNTHLDNEMPTEGTESFYRKFVDNRYKHVNIEALYPDNKITLPTYIYSDWMTLEASKFEWIETVNGVSRVVSTADEYEVPLDRSKVVTLSCTNAYAVNKKLNITITMLIPPTAIIKPITDLTYVEYGQYIELDGSDSYENITRYQWSTGEQTDKIGFYVYGDTTKTLTVYNEYGYNATTFTIRGVLMSQTLVSLNNLTRYSNNLKPKTVTDLTINSNKITVKYLDNHTKQLTLPSGGSSVQTRTVTRIPTYIELHVNVGHVEDEGYLDYSITTNSKVTISAEDIKDIFKFSSDYNSYATGITVTDITASKAYDENDTVFLIAVNMVSPIIYDIYSSFLMSCNKSFGNVTLTDSNILSAVNSISSEEKQSITSQVYGGNSLTIGGSCGNINYGSNYCVVDAVISTDDLGDEGTYIKNNYFKYDTETNESYCYLKLIFKSCLTFDDTAVTFTEVL